MSSGVKKSFDFPLTRKIMSEKSHGKNALFGEEVLWGLEFSAKCQSFWSIISLLKFGLNNMTDT